MKAYEICKEILFFKKNILKSSLFFADKNKNIVSVFQEFNCEWIRISFTIRKQRNGIFQLEFQMKKKII